MRNDTPNLIVNKSFNFAVRIAYLTDELNKQKKYLISKQLFKSGTSIGANIREAQNAESKNDFIHKMKIAAKETDETSFWLELLKAMNYDTEDLINSCLEIQRILSKIISTSKKPKINLALISKLK
jgi:four helix bundle protein